MEAVSGGGSSIVALGVRIGFLGGRGALLSFSKVAFPELRHLLPEKLGLVPLVTCLCLQVHGPRCGLLSVAELSLAVSELGFGISERGIEILARTLPLIQPTVEVLKFLFQLGGTSFGGLGLDRFAACPRSRGRDGLSSGGQVVEDGPGGADRLVIESVVVGWHGSQLAAQ